MDYNVYNFDGYNIEVYDNLFTLAERNNFYNFVVNSKYSLGDWKDSNELEYANNAYFHSLYNSEDLENFGFFKSLGRYDALYNYLQNFVAKKSVVNLSIPSNTYFNHVHNNRKVLLYYVNLRWKEEWAGETLFYDDSLKNILFASPYTPGRVILFDGAIPHTLRSQSGSAPHFRFTFTTFFD